MRDEPKSGEVSMIGGLLHDFSRQMALGMSARGCGGRQRRGVPGHQDKPTHGRRLQVVSRVGNASRKFRNMGKVIAKATLSREHGKTKQTGKPTHTTWWSYADVDRLPL